LVLAEQIKWIEKKIKQTTEGKFVLLLAVIKADIEQILAKMGAKIGAEI
jgi:hypothetical protein